MKGLYFRQIKDERGSASPLCWKIRPFIEVIKYEPEDFISIIKTSLIYSITIIIKMEFFLRTIFCLYCLQFGSVLSTSVHLLLQINGCKNMRTALFCVVCALLIFIIYNIVGWVMSFCSGKNSR